MSSVPGREFGSTPSRDERVPIAISTCGRGLATIVHGKPYVEIVREPEQRFNIPFLLEIHEEKRLRQSEPGEYVPHFNDTIECEYIHDGKIRIVSFFMTNLNDQNPHLFLLGE